MDFLQELIFGIAILILIDKFNNWFENLGNKNSSDNNKNIFDD